MSWQRIELNMIPDTKVLPVVHASQFDSNRSISFQMFTGEDEWTIPEGLTIELHCRKVDDNIVTLSPHNVDGSVITFITTEQLTACSGQNKCELSFINSDDLVIGSLNFILDVEPDPLKGGLTSASSIYDLTQQIEDITTEVIGENYYDKTEVDTLLADKADVSDLPDMSLYYTKTATDTLLSAKADTATTYTKSETDALLATKANTADLATVATTGDYDDLLNKPTIPAAQIQSDYAQSDNTQVDYIKNKPDISGMIAAALLAVMPVDSATGNPCSFDTDIATSLVGLSADIVASGGNGTPSTPIPIVGHSELNLVRCGKNLYSIEQGAYDQNMFDGSGNIVHYPDINLVMLPVEGGSAYSFMFGNTPTLSTYVRIAYVDANGGFISREGPYANTQFPKTITMPNNCKFIQLQINENDQAHISDNDWLFGVIKGSDMPYEPYNGTPYLVQFGQTVYGGEYDANMGKVKPNVYYPLYNGESITGRWLSSKDVYVEGNTPTTGAQVICLDEYDTEIDVPELSVAAIVGANNIISDCGGDVMASYKVSIQKYIDDHV